MGNDEEKAFPSLHARLKAEELEKVGPFYGEQQRERRQTEGQDKQTSREQRTDPDSSREGRQDDRQLKSEQNGGGCGRFADGDGTKSGDHDEPRIQSDLAMARGYPI